MTVRTVETDFDDILRTVARTVVKTTDIDNLGRALGFDQEDIQRCLATNFKSQVITYSGTLEMLRDWRKTQVRSTERSAIKTALNESGFIHLADEIFGEEQVVGSKMEGETTDKQVNIESKMQTPTPDDVQNYVPQQPSDPTDESSQQWGVIRLEKHHIEVRVPRSMHLTENDVRAITEVPPELVSLMKDNEAIICVGLEIPYDATFSTPIKVTIPHSAIFTKPASASVGTYYRENSADRFLFKSDVNGKLRCEVRERDLDLYLDHFSEWWIIAFITRVFIGKRVVCTPHVPISAPMNAEHLVRLCIRDYNAGIVEVKPGYMAPIDGEEFFIAWRSGDLKVTCNANGKNVAVTKRNESAFRYFIGTMNIPFLVNTTRMNKSRIFVEFILEQSSTIEIFCPMDLSGPSVTSGEIVPGASETSAFASVGFRPQSAPLERRRTTPESVGISPQGEPSAVREITTSTVSDPVSDDKLDILSRHIPSAEYDVLCNKLGIEHNEARSILETHQANKREAGRECLAMWKNKTGGSLNKLKEILHDAELKDLIKYIK